MDEQQGEEKKKRMKNNITYRSPINGLLEAIPNMILQISDVMQGDVIILSLSHPIPRAVPRRAVLRGVSFRQNIETLASFCFFIFGVYYSSINNETMKWEKKALLISLLFSNSMLFISFIEVSQLTSRILALQDRRPQRLFGWFQEALVVITFVAMTFWILRTPVVAPVAILFPT